MKRLQRQAWMLILLALLLGSSSLSAQDEQVPIIVVGSAIVAPVFEALAEASQVEATFDVSASGTGGGFTAFCQGQADVTLATRSISVAEDAACAASGVEYASLLLGHQILAFVVYPETDFVQCLTGSDLATILAPSAQGQITNWNQVNGEYPDLALTILVPESDSPAMALLDSVVDGDGIRSDAAVPGSDEAILQTVNEQPGTLGVVGLKAAQEAGDEVHILDLDAGQGAGCTAPSAENIEQRVYLAGEDLLAYFNRASLEKPGLREVLGIASGADNAETVSRLGLVIPSDAAYEANLAALEGREVEPQFSNVETTFAIPDTLAGQLAIAGVAHGYPYVESITSSFTSVYPNVTVNATGETEATAIRGLCEGSVDIVVAIRDLTEEQAASCEANQINTMTIELGNQAVVLLANTDSDYLQCLTSDEVATIWRAESGNTVTTWNQVNDSFPETAMTLFAPELGNSYTDLLLTVTTGEVLSSRVDTEFNDDALYRAAATANVEGALTYISWPDYQRVLENQQGNIQLVAINSGAECILPDEETIGEGSYPLTRPARLIVSRTALARLEVQSFLWYLASDDNYALLEDAGFVGLSFGELPALRANLEQAYAEAQAEAAARAEATPEATVEPGAEVTPEATFEATPEATQEASG